MKNESKKKLRFIDLFAGVGGFRVGIERAFKCCGATNLSKTSWEKSRRYEKDSSNIKQIGLASKQSSCGESNNNSAKGLNGYNRVECVFTNEWDKYCCQVYNKNFGTKIEPTDITKVKADSIPDFDLLCGGFPCQSFSLAGKRRGFEDTRGTMFFEIARILKAKRPKFVLLENVKGLLNHDKGETFKVIIQTLEELGYEVEWMVLNSKFFGVAQNRERLFIIGSLGGEPRPEILPFRETDEFNIQSNKKLPMQSSNTIRTNYSSGYSNETYVSSMIEAQMISNVYGGLGGGKFTDTSPTIRTPKGGCHLPMVKKDLRIRRLTPTECERLQSFPDNFTKYGVNVLGETIEISDTQRYKMMGNAVTCNVVEAIIRRWFVLWEL